MAKNTKIEYNIKNVKYAVKDTQTGEYGQPQDLAYADSIKLDAEISELKVYGDGELTASLVSDNGYSGTLTLIQYPNEYEIAMGRKILLSCGLSDVSQLSNVYHAIYFELDTNENGVKKVGKVWLYNVISQKPGVNLSQSTDNVNINNVELALTITGDNVKDNGGLNDYVDSNGNKLKIFKATSKPGDTNYDTFENAVPTPTILPELGD